VVRDQSGAIIPNAKVTITNVATNISSSSQTDDRGYYIFNGLHPARYTVAAQATGFQIKEEKDVVLTFQGNYTFSKATDDSSAGANAFVGNLNTGNPQELDNLRAEHGISANHATHRLAFAAVLEIPIGRGRWLGKSMNRIADAAIGGWSLSSSVTFQSAQRCFLRW
jgi:hypothetical protein